MNTSVFPGANVSNGLFSSATAHDIKANMGHKVYTIALMIGFVFSQTPQSHFKMHNFVILGEDVLQCFHITCKIHYKLQFPDL